MTVFLCSAAEFVECGKRLLHQTLGLEGTEGQRETARWREREEIDRRRETKREKRGEMHSYCFVQTRKCLATLQRKMNVMNGPPISLLLVNDTIWAGQKFGEIDIWNVEVRHRE